MRQRVEDLGRLAVLLKNLLDLDIFLEGNRPRRPKDYDEWWEHLSDIQKDCTLSRFVYGIEELEGKIYDLLEIAHGTDILNQPEEY